MKKIYITPRLEVEGMILSDILLALSDLGNETDKPVTDGGAAKFGYFYFEDEEDDE